MIDSFASGNGGMLFMLISFDLVELFDDCLELNWRGVGIKDFLELTKDIFFEDFFEGGFMDLRDGGFED